MALNCTRCDGTGFLNSVQIPQQVFERGNDAVLAWMGLDMAVHDVTVCDCCGDGEDWYGTPGEHYGQDDPPGPNGPYAYNGGLCECH